jgi:hypothetical protein
MQRSQLYGLLLCSLIATPVAAQMRSHAIQVKEIDFKGGTLAQYVSLLRKEFDTPNLIVDNVGNITLPSAQIRSSLGGAVGWVPNVAAARDKYVVLQTTRTDSTVVYTFTTARPQTLRTETAENAKLVKTYALLTSDGWTQPTAPHVKALLDSLLLKRSEAPGVHYSASTGLLVVTAPASDVRIADQVIEEMDRARRAAQSFSATGLQERIRSLTRQRDSLEAVIRDMRRTK